MVRAQWSPSVVTRMSRFLAQSGLPRQRVTSWLVTSLLVGWLIVYNVFRIAKGDEPRTAAAVSLPIGLALGVGLFALTLIGYRSFAKRGWVHPDDAGERPVGIMDEPRVRRSLELTGVLCGVFAVIALAVGMFMLVGWLDAPSTSRSTPKIVIAIWNLFVGLWLAYEPFVLRRGDTSDVDAVGLAALITAVLGGVALARDIAATGQVALIIVAGILAATAQLAFWRLHGSKGLTFAPFGAAIVAAFALIIPLAA